MLHHSDNTGVTVMTDMTRAQVRTGKPLNLEIMYSRWVIIIP